MPRGKRKQTAAERKAKAIRLAGLSRARKAILTAKAVRKNGGLQNLGDQARLAGQASQEQAQQLTQAEQALQLKIMGVDYRTIGARLGISAFKAHGLVHDALMEIRESNQALAEYHRELELRRYEKDLLALAAARARGDVKAIETSLRIRERKAKLLGLDVPRQDSVPVEQVITFIRQSAEAFLEIVTDEALRKLYSQRLRRLTGPMVRSVIEARAEPTTDTAASETQAALPVDAIV